MKQCDYDEKDRLAFVTARGATTWEDWVALGESFGTRLGCLRGARVGLVLEPDPESYALFVALVTTGTDVFLVDEAYASNPGAAREQLGLDALIATQPGGEIVGLEAPGGPQRQWSRAGGKIVLFTSGSSGQPKAIGHSWQTLSRPVRRSDQDAGRRWLLTYRPRLYAGLQVFLQCLINRGTLVLPSRDASVREILELMEQARVACVSATPSYWRRLLTFAEPHALGRLELTQITLGGEVVDQGVLDALKRAFPDARLAHIYATSEVGRCFSVTDGRAGFPVAFLEAPSTDGIELKIEDGELFVRSANAMLEDPGADGLWFATGDLVERREERVYFAGRRTDIINVGGNKVNPLIVEQVIQSIPGVLDVRVYAKRSSLVGQMVACEIVVADGYDEAQVRASVHEHCREQLAAHNRPRFIDVVPAIALSGADKKIRGVLIP
jgi:acyl-CoA synthetase (AMP-forming)/AMP-acid ligase II